MLPAEQSFDMKPELLGAQYMLLTLTDDLLCQQLKQSRVSIF